MNETFNKTTEVTHTSKSRAIGIPEATFWCTIFILEAVLIVTGNLLITVVFVRSRRLQKRRYYLIINLAISDTLVGALALPMFIVPFGKSFNVWNTETAVHGDAMLFFDMFSGFASITFLTMISLERLYATLRPFSYRALKSRWYVLLTIIAWIVAASIPSLHLAAINYPDMQLSSTKKAMVSMWVPFLSALLIIICVSYLIIWKKVKVVNRSVRKERAVEKESSLSRICLLVTVVSVVAWLPFVVVCMVINSDIGLFFNNFCMFYVLYITKILHYANSLLNPVLYVLKIPEFKASLSQLFKTKDTTTIDLTVPLTPTKSIR